MNAIIDGFCGCFHSNPSHGMMARDENHFYSEPSRKINKNRNIFAKKKEKFSEKGFHSSYHGLHNKHSHTMSTCCAAVRGLELKLKLEHTDMM